MGRLQCIDTLLLFLQAQLMYPHIASTDAKANTNATWLRSINERSFHFSKWGDVKACKAVFGQRGERAIFNGDILPRPAGMQKHVKELSWVGVPRGGGLGARHFLPHRMMNCLGTSCPYLRLLGTQRLCDILAGPPGRGRVGRRMWMKGVKGMDLSFELRDG